MNTISSPVNQSTINERVDVLIKHLRKNAKTFAESINKTPTAISTIVNGRNKPGFDLLEAIFKTYPQISRDWLLLGEGPMILDDSAKMESITQKKYVTSLEERVAEQSATIRFLLGKSDNVLIARFAAMALFFMGYCDKFGYIIFS